MDRNGQKAQPRLIKSSQVKSSAAETETDLNIKKRTETDRKDQNRQKCAEADEKEGKLTKKN